MATRGRPSNKSIHAKDSAQRKRTPLGARNLLTATNIPEGWEGRWINDVNDRIVQARSAGYEFVTNSGVVVGDKSVDSTEDSGDVISRPVGNGVTAYLMAVPVEYAEETRRMKDAKVKETERGIKAETEKPGHYGEFKQNVGKHV